MPRIPSSFPAGGQAEFVPLLARVAVAVGVSAVFIEIHEEPSRSPSDGPNMVRLDEMEGLLTTFMKRVTNWQFFRLL